jgi:Zn finger protein HypA/HybF involved in hydrogenase expression
MPAAASVTCPKCKRTFKGRVEMDGKKVRCPACQAPFVVRLGDTLKIDLGGEEDRITAATPAARPARPKVVPAKAAPPPAAAEDIDLNDIPDRPASPASGVPAEAIAVGAPGAAARPPSGEQDDEDDDNPYGVTSQDLRARCPNCANPMESEDAVICLHCGYNTQTRVHGRTEKLLQQTGGDRLKWLMPGLLCAGGMVLLAIWCFFHALALPSMLAGTWAAFLTHESMRFWITIIALGMIWGLGKFAHKRLILEPTPPEITKD